MNILEIFKIYFAFVRINFIFFPRSTSINCAHKIYCKVHYSIHHFFCSPWLKPISHTASNSQKCQIYFMYKLLPIRSNRHTIHRIWRSLRLQWMCAFIQIPLSRTLLQIYFSICMVTLNSTTGVGDTITLFIYGRNVGERQTQENGCAYTALNACVNNFNLHGNLEYIFQFAG